MYLVRSFGLSFFMYVCISLVIYLFIVLYFAWYLFRYFSSSLFSDVVSVVCRYFFSSPGLSLFRPVGRYFLLS